MATGATETTDSGPETGTEFGELRPDWPGQLFRTTSSPTSEPEDEPASSAAERDDGETDSGSDDQTDESRTGEQTDESRTDEQTDETTSTPEVSTVSAEDDGFGDKGSKGPYWVVELEPPPGASEGLISYIAMAEAAMQTAVDLLGRGMPIPPPQVEELLATAVHESLGQGAADEAYRDTLIKVDSRQTSLLAMDNQVADTAIIMAAEEDQTLRSIISIVEHVKSVLAAVGSADLKPEAEIKLMDLIASALELIYDKVTAVADFSAEMAGGEDEDPSSGGSGGAAVPAGGGGGGAAGLGGLGSMLPMLAMLPMSLMPLAGMLPELLEGNEEDKEEEQAADSEPAPAPIDPTAPPQDQQGPPLPESDAPAPENAAAVQA